MRVPVIRLEAGEAEALGEAALADAEALGEGDDLAAGLFPLPPQAIASRSASGAKICRTSGLCFIAAAASSVGG